MVDAGKATQAYASSTPQDLAHRIESGQVALVDVRGDAEWSEGHIAQAQHKFLGRLPDTLSDLPLDKSIVVQCRSGTRSSIGASVLQAAGFNVINLTGGYRAWTEAGLATTTETKAECEAGCRI